MNEKSKRAPASSNTSKIAQKSLSKSEAYRIYQTLGQMKGLVSEPRYVYALVMARKKLQPIAEAIEEMVKPPERIQQYEQQRQTLCKEYAVKDTNGQPKISPEQHFIIEPLKQAEFNEKLGELHTTYEDELETYQTTVKTINIFLSGDSEIVDLPSIPLSAIKNNISFEQMEALFPLVDSDTAT